MTSHQMLYQELVNHFGGQVKTAEALGCKQPSVWAWLDGKTHMSAPLALKAERITNGKFASSALCPALAALEVTE